MTERDLYDAALIEINKLEAPSMLLEDYNYFINKAIQQYINKVYNRYEINQQATDDLNVLKVNKTLKLTKIVLTIEDKMYFYPSESAATYAKLPEDYMHMLNCIVSFNTANPDYSGCNGAKDLATAKLARKLTSDIYPSIINNAYFKPSYKTPYYNIRTVDKSTYDSNQIIDILIGDSKFTPTQVDIHYIKKPRKVELTEDMLDGIEDKSSEMEFPDYVCYEIINEFVKLLLENASDPRLQTNIPINQTIIPQTSE